MLRALLLSAFACATVSTAQAQEMNLQKYQGMDSGAAAKYAEVQLSIRQTLGDRYAQLADNMFYRGVSMPVEGVAGGGVLFHACKPHDCGTNEVRLVVLPNRQVFANLMLSGKPTIFGRAPTPQIAQALVISQ